MWTATACTICCMRTSTRYALPSRRSRSGWRIALGCDSARATCPTFPPPSTQDGKIDAIHEDLDGDGVADLVHEDVDGDGVYDLIHEDLDGDGVRAMFPYV